MDWSNNKPPWMINPTFYPTANCGFSPYESPLANCAMSPEEIIECLERDNERLKEQLQTPFCGGPYTGYSPYPPCYSPYDEAKAEKERLEREFGVEIVAFQEEGE